MSDKTEEQSFQGLQQKISNFYNVNSQLLGKVEKSMKPESIEQVDIELYRIALEDSKKRRDSCKTEKDFQYELDIQSLLNFTIVIRFAGYLK